MQRYIKDKILVRWLVKALKCLGQIKLNIHQYKTIKIATQLLLFFVDYLNERFLSQHNSFTL